ncbi:HAD family hydrolase [candidate division KSB1 bacterium]
MIMVLRFQPVDKGEDLIELVIFDVDGTLTAHGSVWRYFHEKLGIWDGEAERFQTAFLRGEISYDRFCRLDAGLWRGLPEERLRELADRIEYNPGVAEAVARLRQAGLHLAVVSTGLSLLVDRVASELGIEFALSNRLLAENGQMTGEVELMLSDGSKGAAVEELTARSGIEPGAMAAVGDSETDLDLFRSVGFSVAYGEVPEVVAGAADRHVPGGDFGPVADIILERLNGG